MRSSGRRFFILVPTIGVVALAACHPHASTASPPSLVVRRSPGTVIVTNMNDNTATLLDGATLGTLATLPTGRAPHEVAVSRDGRWALVSNYGAKDPGNTLTVIDVDARVARQPEGVAITPNGLHAWAASNRDSVVIVVDLQRGVPIDTIRGFGLAYRIAVSPDGRSVVITDPVKDVIRIFDESTRRERWQIAIPPDSLVATAEVKGSASPEGVTISRDSRTAYVTLQGRNRVIAIDLDQGRVTGWGMTGTWSDGIGFSPRSAK